jgi:alkanesulfonate monooxygenase SsuD/methylene tetrahydromethanopterin reductase-like flavin-dependent oxidoreductase (luciferase family)
MVGTSEASLIQAGRRGVSIAAGGPVPYAIYAPGIDGYKQVCVERGHPPDIAFIRLVYLGETEKHIREEAEPYVRNFLDFNASAIDSIAHRKDELTATGYRLYASGIVEQFRQLTYDQCMQTSCVALGRRTKWLPRSNDWTRPLGVSLRWSSSATLAASSTGKPSRLRNSLPDT